jgi:hypothetical protein
VPDPSVDLLRQQLRDRGYLSHGIERWFALDPWSSRTFWLELAIVALKAALVIALFGILPPTAIMLFRNHPLSPLETVDLALIYGATGIAVVFALIVLIGLVLKLRPALAVDTPRALLVISLAAAALLTAVIGIWWARFATPPTLVELVTGIALTVIFFLMATIVVSAALLSFSIYELKRVPAIHQHSRTVPMTVAAIVLLALLFIPAYAGQEKSNDHEPLQVVTTPVTRRVALVAVDGLTFEIFASRADLERMFISERSILTNNGPSTAERWATAGTGVPTRLHGVRAIEGVRFRGGSHIIQTISDADFPIRTIGTRLPLPPTVRKRDFVWELFAHRGMPVLAVNWWTSSEGVTQQTVFAQAKGDALAVDEIAARHLLAGAGHAQFVTVYLPALDVILNRLPLARSAQLALSVRALDRLGQTIAALKARGYDVIVLGMPGDHQDGRAVIASTIALAPGNSAYDIAPTLCALLGFPASNEMSGRSLTGEVPRIATYGNRSSSPTSTKVDEEYYENLKSLGYIR